MCRCDERAQLVPSADDTVRLVREPRPHVEDPVLGEAVDPALLVAVVDRVTVAVEVLQNRLLGLEEGKARFEVAGGHISIFYQTVGWCNRLGS